MRYNDTKNTFLKRRNNMLKKIAHIVYWVVVYTLSFTGGYLFGRLAQDVEERIGLVDR